MNDPEKSEQFTGRARKVLSLAQEEAQRFQHNAIGTEHLLLGLVREREGVAGKVLANLGVDLDKARSAVELVAGRGDRIVLGEINLTPQARKVIRLAVDESRRLNHNYIGTEHLLLGVLHNDERIAVAVLALLGIDLEMVRTQIIRVQNSILAPATADLERDIDQIVDKHKFTERARTVLSLAREEAQHFQHNAIGPEHLLLGLVCERKGAAAKVLASLGVEINKVRSAVELIVGRGDRIVLGEINLTPQAQKVIRLAIDESRRLNHDYIGTEHLLLGVLRNDESIAVAVLAILGINLEMVRTQAVRLRNSAFRPETADLERDIDQIVGKHKFTERAKKVLSFAKAEAQRFHHNYIGTEHLLLGLVREGDGLAAKVLDNLDVDLNKVRSAVEFIIGRGDSIVLGVVGLTPRAKEVVDLAIDEARRLDHHSIGTEHLLLGLVRQGEGIAAGVLESLGVNLEKVHKLTIQMSTHQTGEGPP